MSGELDVVFLQECLAELRSGEEVTIHTTLRDRRRMRAALVDLGATDEEMSRVTFETYFPGDAP